MHYLYGSKKGVDRRLVATFGSEQQLLAYVHWATLKSLGERRGKFEQGSALASYDAWEKSIEAALPTKIPMKSLTTRRPACSDERISCLREQ